MTKSIFLWKVRVGCQPSLAVRGWTTAARVLTLGGLGAPTSTHLPQPLTKPSTNGNAARVESLPWTKVARVSAIRMSHHTARLWPTCVIETLADTVMRPLLREFYPVRSQVCCRIPQRLHRFSFSSQYCMIIGGFSQWEFSFRYYSFFSEAISVGASPSATLRILETCA